MSSNLLNMLAAGIIRPSKFSGWSTQDFRKLNAVTIKDAYPIPNITTMVNQLGKAKIFSKIDLTHGYYQIEIDEASKPYTAFGCELGLFEFNRMAMGLTNACETFQRMMDSAFEGYITKFCFFYLDDRHQQSSG